MALNTLWLQNVDYPARLDRTLFDNLWTEGILGSASFAVSPSSPAAMTVRVAAGVAVIQGDDQVFQGKYLTREEATTTGLVISAAPGSGTRHDLVVISVRDPNAGGPAGDNAIIRVITGVASGSPVDPAIPNSSLVLARVRVPAGTGSITAGLIDDLRVAAKDTHDTIPAGSVDLADLSTAAQQALSPTGAIMAYGGTTAPVGWLLCDGTAYATATYPALSAVLGTAYNTSAGQASPGAGNFRVPILKGRVPAGLDVGVPAFATLGSTGGAVSVTLTAAESGVNTHSHAVSVSGTSGNESANHAHNATVAGGTSFVSNDHSHNFSTSSDGSHGHTLDITGANLSNHTHSATVSTSAAGTTSPVAGSGAVSNIVNSAGSHSHSGTTTGVSANHTHTFSVGVTTTGTSVPHTHTTTSTGSATTISGAAAVTAHENLQPYLTINYIIKT